MTTLRVAAVQATYVLMDREATIDRVAELTAAAAAQGAQLVVFPEAFVPGTPIWIDTQPIWDGDADWFRLLAENAVVVPGPATDRLGAIAREHGVWLVVGVQEKEPNGGTIYNTTAVPVAGRSADREASQAHADGLGADGLGHGRWLDASGRGHAVRTDRRADLLGELHAPGAVPHVRAGHRPVARADPRDRRRLDRDDAAPRAREPHVRRRRQPGPARRPDPERLPAPRSTGAGRLPGRERPVAGGGQHGHRRTRRATSSRARFGSGRRRSSPTSTWEPWRQPVGFSTPSGTTTARTCSGSMSTRRRDRRSSSTASPWTSVKTLPPALYRRLAAGIKVFRRTSNRNWRSAPSVSVTNRRPFTDHNPTQ